MTNHETSRKTAATLDPIIRAAGAAPSHPLAPGGNLAGHVAIHGTSETHTSPAGVLRALAAMGVSRGPWQDTATGARRAVLSDLDGEERGEVLHSEAGACATLWYALCRPMACFGE
jgi:hypothetical protein